MPSRPDVHELIHRLPCDVRLPEDWLDFFNHSGPLPGNYDDQRRYPRFYCRTEGALMCRPTLPVVPREKKCHRVYVIDISRTSIAFLHSEQLFPYEQAEFVLPDGTKRMILVVRCQKVGPNCYDIAGKFADAE